MVRNKNDSSVKLVLGKFVKPEVKELKTRKLLLSVLNERQTYSEHEIRKELSKFPFLKTKRESQAVIETAKDLNILEPINITRKWVAKIF